MICSCRRSCASRHLFYDFHTCTPHAYRSDVFHTKIQVLHTSTLWYILGPTVHKCFIFTCIMPKQEYFLLVSLQFRKLNKLLRSIIRGLFLFVVQKKKHKNPLRIRGKAKKKNQTENIFFYRQKFELHNSRFNNAGRLTKLGSSSLCGPTQQQS